SDECRHRLACIRPRYIDRRSDRKAVQQIFARIERQKLLAGFRDHEHRLAGADVLADLGDDDTNDAISGRAQDGLVEAALKHRQRGGRSLDLRVSDGALLARRSGDRGVMVCFRLGDVGARVRYVVLSLVERLLRGEIAARERAHAGQLRLRMVEPRFRFRNLGLERGYLLGANAGIDVVARGFRGGELRARLPDRSGQLDRGQLGDDVAYAHARAGLDLDGGELAADLGRDADLGRAYDAHDRRRPLPPPP